jgi:cell division protein DivIC
MTKKKFILKNFNANKQKLKPVSSKQNRDEDVSCYEKKSHRKIRWASIILTGFLIFAIAECSKQYMRIQDMKDQLNVYNIAYEDAQKEQNELKEQLALFQNASYLARIARENLRLVKPGEYLIVPAEESDALDLVKDGTNASDLH